MRQVVEILLREFLHERAVVFQQLPSVLQQMQVYAIYYTYLHHYLPSSNHSC